MELKINIPDEIAVRLQPNGGDVSRWLLEMAALEGMKSGRLTPFQVRQMLGLQTQMEVDAFLKEHEVYFDYSDDDLAQEAETSKKLLESRAKQ